MCSYFICLSLPSCYMLHSLFRLIVRYSAFLANFRRYFRPLRCVFQVWNFSAEVLLYSGTIRHFFSVSCSLISLFFSLFLARSQALELEHLSRESEESATRGTGLKERTCCFILPLFPLLHFTARFSRFSLVCISARVHTSRLRAYSWKTVDFYYGGGRRTACGTAGVV